MPVRPPQYDHLCWHAWPCERCRGSVTIFDFIVGCHEADRTLRGSTPDEVIDEATKKERRWLWEWAFQCPHAGESSGAFAKISEGSEHLVYLTASGESVLKLTKPGIFGDSYFLKDGRVHQRCCTPSDYLLRMEMLRIHFGFAPISIGVTKAGQIVTLQKFVAGDLPTQSEADAFLRESGAQPVKQSCFIWNVPGFGDVEFWIGDARDENFVKTPEGIVPIDLRMWAVEMVPPT